MEIWFVTKAAKARIEALVPKVADNPLITPLVKIMEIPDSYLDGVVDENGDSVDMIKLDLSRFLSIDNVTPDWLSRKIAERKAKELCDDGE